MSNVTPSAVTPSAVVVVGATGYLGGHVARYAHDAGWQVLAAGRAPGALAALADEGLAVLDLGAPDAAGRLVAWSDGRDVRGVVAASGGWWLGETLVDLDPATWRSFLESHLTAHLDVVQRLAPALPPGAAWVVLNGAASHEPMVGSGPVSVTGAALHMLVAVLRAEGRPPGVRFHEVVVEHAVAGDARNLDPATEVTTDAVATAVLGVVRDPSAPSLVRVGG